MRTCVRSCVFFLLCVVGWGCGGPVGLLDLAAMHSMSAVAGLGTQALMRNMFGGVGGVQEVRHVECRTLENKEYCREIPPVSPHVSVEFVSPSPPPSSVRTIKDSKGCEWTPEDGGKWKNCPKEDNSKKPLASVN